MRLSTLVLIASCWACRTNDSASEARSLFDANGQKVDESDANGDRPAWRSLTPEDGFSGVGVLGVDLWIATPDVCTAWIVDAGVDAAPAYVVTNAHCNFFQHLGGDFLRPDEFREHKETDYFVVMNHLVSVPEGERKKIGFRELRYITENGTDLAIFETVESVGAVKAMGFKPLKIATTRPAVGLPVRLIGVPLRTRDEAFKSLHISACTVGEEVALKNGDYRAPHSVKHRCSSIPGFSGGPLVAADGTVALLNSHGTDDFSTDPACTYATMPCEVAADGTTHADPDGNYAQYVDGLAACFDAAGEFALTHAGCTLPGGVGAR